MMNIVVIVIAAAIFVSGVYVNQKQKSRKLENPTEESVLSSDVTSSDVNSDEAQEPSLTAVSTPTAVPKTTPTPNLIATPAAISESKDLNIYKYPNSRVVSSSSSSLTLESSDNPDAITDWYKEKIKSEQMSVTSFVTTKTNDNVLNKLVGANSQKELSVEIKKESGDSFVRIVVSLQT